MLEILLSDRRKKQTPDMLIYGVYISGQYQVLESANIESAALIYAELLLESANIESAALVYMEQLEK